MQEKFNIQDQQIVQALQQGYIKDGRPINVVDLTFLPIGADPSASVYSAVTANNDKFFLKLKRGKLNPSAYLVPRLLNDNQIPQIVAPLATRSGTLWYPIPDTSYSLIVYPFVEARTAYDAKLTQEQWRDVGAILRNIHKTPVVAAELDGLRQETFQLHPKSGPSISKINDLIDNHNVRDPFQQQLADFWQNKRNEITRIVARTIELGQLCQQKAQPFVICHADFHIFNILVDSDDALYVVDWDETVLAPVERDLMFVVGQSAGLITVKDFEQAAFLDGYGCTEADIDAATIAYYRYEWAVQEIGEYGGLVFLDDEFGDETKADSVKSFMGLFDSGDVVEAAYRADAMLNSRTI